VKRVGKKREGGVTYNSSQFLHVMPLSLHISNAALKCRNWLAAIIWEHCMDLTVANNLNFDVSAYWTATKMANKTGLPQDVRQLPNFWSISF
jgi:hypothetical protein